MKGCDIAIYGWIIYIYKMAPKKVSHHHDSSLNRIKTRH